MRRAARATAAITALLYMPAGKQTGGDALEGGRLEDWKVGSKGEGVEESMESKGEGGEGSGYVREATR